MLFRSRYGSPAQIGRMLLQHARAEWDASVQYDARGNLVAPGKVLSPKDAAEALERREREYVSKLQARLTPAPVGGAIGGPRLSQQQPQQSQQQRRTLSNSITASTPGAKPGLQDRRARAIAAFNAARKP